MSPRDPQTANHRRKSKPKLDMPETELIEMLHQYCDLRRRGFDQQAIKTKSGWTKHHQNLLLEEARKARHARLPEKPRTGRERMAARNVRRRCRTQGHPKDIGLSILASRSEKLQDALDAASGPAPTDLKEAISLLRFWSSDRSTVTLLDAQDREGNQGKFGSWLLRGG